MRHWGNEMKRRSTINVILAAIFPRIFPLLLETPLKGRSRGEAMNNGRGNAENNEQIDRKRFLADNGVSILASRRTFPF